MLRLRVPGHRRHQQPLVHGERYDDFLNSSAFTPYIGGGVGAARVSLNSVGITSPVNATVSGDDWQFAYQGIAGVRYSSTQTGLRASTTGTSPHWIRSSPEVLVARTSPQSTQYHTHNIMLGLAYHFTPPAPPPPMAAAPPPPAPPMAAPPPAMAKQFVVYFEFDKSNLTPKAEGGVGRPRPSSRAGRPGGSAGYTDLAGTQQYNLGLSKRRAETVRAGLVKSGVPTT